MKKILFLMTAFFSLVSFVSGDTSFVSLLQQKGVDTDALSRASTVSRYTVTEILNLVDCNDCHRPSSDIIATLSQSWWDRFRLFPGKNFDDIAYNTDLDRSNMYYCVAYVGNQGYMNGFPRSTSPVCSGRFCGNLSITNADVLQTIFNITAKTFYTQYVVNRSTIRQWLDTQPQYVQNYFGVDDRSLIQAGVTRCGNQSCALSTVGDMAPYMKYCTFEPGACNMQEFPFAPQGKWPIAEMNVLLQQGVLTPQDIQGLNIENFAEGAFVLDVFGRVKQRSQCVDDDDLDNDGISNYNDNCYTIYNPQQRDGDQDGIGDACDDDIDNDTIKNPIGILDDAGNIVYSVVKNWKDKNPQGSIDNCLTIFNTDQRDDDENGVGNTCDIDERVGLRVQARALSDNRFAFTSQYSGSLRNFIRYFGDRTTGNGESANHTYRDPGQYTVRLEAQTPRGRTIAATTTVTVLPPSPVLSQGVRASLLPAKLVQNVGERVQYAIQLQNLQVTQIDYVNIIWGDGRSRQLRGNDITSFQDAYSTFGGYGIVGVVYLLDGRRLPIGSYVTVVGLPLCMGNTNNNWQGRCDMDKDTIPDLCDADIDGDGIANQLGLIRFERPGCIYDTTNTNIPPLSGPGRSGTGRQLPTRDNCPFVPNPAQGPCRALDGDADGDGIPDRDDVCSLIPETFNGIADADGCPEFDQTVFFPPTKLQPGTCNTCPCQYASNDSDIAAGDRIKAVLYDMTTQKPVAESSRYVVP